jgi:hypothetical protein
MEDRPPMSDAVMPVPSSALTPSSAMLSLADRLTLEGAVRRLMGSRGVVVRVADLLGGLFGSAAAAGWRGLRVPDRITTQLRGIAEVALKRAFDVAVIGRAQTEWVARPRTAQAITIASGAISGFVGFAGFLPDATATTLLIMRNIAAIATEEGEDLATEEARQACLEVFALGSPDLSEHDMGDRSYWSARLVMHGRPMSLLLSEVAATYGLRLSQKFASTIVPLVGAASGALVNSVFLEHYRNVARVHFTIRRLERRYGPSEVRREAEEIASSLRPARRRGSVMG